MQARSFVVVASREERVSLYPDAFIRGTSRIAGHIYWCAMILHKIIDFTILCKFNARTHAKPLEIATNFRARETDREMLDFTTVTITPSVDKRLA